MARVRNFLFFFAFNDRRSYSLGGVINDFRSRRLGLEPLSVRSGPGIVDRLKVPWTYCFSPEIVQKPDDWRNHIGIHILYLKSVSLIYIAS
jgi:sterol 3beta-glucosyltransferase